MRHIEKGIMSISLLGIIICGTLSFFYCGTINFQTYWESDVSYSKNGVLQIITVLVGILVFVLLARFFRKSKRRITVLICVSCILFAVLVSVAWCMSNTYPAIADQKKIWDAILGFVKGSYDSIDQSYFEQNYHQAGIVVLFAAILKVLKSQSIMVFRITNILAAGATVAGLEWLSCELFHRNVIVIMTGILSAVFFPICIYTSFIYGTSISLALIVISFAILVRFLRHGGKEKLVLLAALLALAKLVYSGAAIAIVAVFIILGMHAVSAVREHGVKACRIEIMGLILLVLIPVLAGTLVNVAFEKQSGISNTGGIPATAYVLMGITSEGENTACGPGSYDATNVYIYEISGRDHDAANKEALSRINYAVRDYVRGRRNWKFFVKKLRNEWTDPWFSSAVMTVYLWSDELEISDGFRAFLTCPFVQGIQSFLRAFKTGIYCLAAVAVGGILYEMKKFKKLQCDGSREEDWAKLLLPLYFLGGFVFYLFWEAKARYCFPYFVCLIPLAAYGLSKLADAAIWKTNGSKAEA